MKKLKITAIGDSIMSGVNSDTTVGQKYSLVMAQRDLLSSAFFARLKIMACVRRIVTNTKSFRQWRKKLVPTINKKLGKILSNPSTSWVIGSKNWCLPSRLSRLLGKEVTLTNMSEMGKAWYHFFDKEELLPSEQDIIVIQLGNNDFFEGKFLRGETTDYLKKIKVVLSNLCQRNPKAVIMINCMSDVPLQLTCEKNHTTMAYVSTWPFIKSKTVADLQKKWAWGQKGCGIFTTTKRTDLNFQTKQLSFHEFNHGLKEITEELNRHFNGMIRVCQLFDQNWYPSADDQTISVDGTHPGIRAHQIGALRLSLVIADAYQTVHGLSVLNADNVDVFGLPKI